MSEQGPGPEARARRLLVAQLAPGEQRIEGQAAHHAIHVLRLAVGDPVALFDGEGREARAEILAIDRKGSALLVRSSEPAAQPRLALSLEVAMAVPRGPRADWAVEKLTELGVARIRWLTCERSVTEPRPSRLSRWQRIAAAAAEQCGRAAVPHISGPVPFSELLTAVGSNAFVADRAGGALGLARVAVATLVVGPEGGLTRHELESAEEAGYTRVSLGSWTLRVETAAVAGAAVLLGAWAGGEHE